MNRLALPDTDRLTPEQQAVHDKVINGPRGRIAGALTFWLHRPELLDRAQELGLYLRYGTKLPPRLSELAILVTARHWGAEFEWMHAPIALEAGHSKAAVEAIKLGKVPDFEREDETLVYEIARDIYTNRHLSDELYRQGVDVLGEDGLIDLVGILGYYSMLSLTLNTFRILPEPRVENWSTDIRVG